MLRWTRIYRAEAAFAEIGCEARRQARQVRPTISALGYPSVASAWKH